MPHRVAMTINDICAMAKATLGDSAVFTALQAAILILLLYGWVKDQTWLRRETGVEATVKRGEGSWALFPAMFGLLALVVVEVNNTTEAWKGYKTITTLADLAALIYLCYFSSWFRNKTVGAFVRSRNMEEK